MRGTTIFIRAPVHHEEDSGCACARWWTKEISLQIISFNVIVAARERDMDTDRYRGENRLVHVECWDRQKERSRERVGLGLRVVEGFCIGSFLTVHTSIIFSKMILPLPHFIRLLFLTCSLSLTILSFLLFLSLSVFLFLSLCLSVSLSFALHLSLSVSHTHTHTPSLLL